MVRKRAKKGGEGDPQKRGNLAAAPGNCTFVESCCNMFQSPADGVSIADLVTQPKRRFRHVGLSKIPSIRGNVSVGAVATVHMQVEAPLMVHAASILHTFIVASD